MTELKIENFLKSLSDDLSDERGRREFWIARRVKTEAEFVATQLVAAGGPFPRRAQDYPCRVAGVMARSLGEIATRIAEMGNPIQHKSYPWEMPRAVVGQTKSVADRISSSLVAADSGSPYAAEFSARRLNEIADELAEVWAPYMRGL